MAVNLDEGQYARAEIDKYEAIYGRGFVSPGGAETARECIAALGLRAGDHVLDVGCGLGGSAFLMAAERDARVHAIDLSANMIERARERLAASGLGDRVALEQADCLALDTVDRYDAVYSRDVFLHVHDKPRLLATLHRILVSGGRLFFTDYCCGPRPWSDAFAAYVRDRGYDLHTIEDYAAHLRAAGFEDVRAEDHTERFLAIHVAELERLVASPLDPGSRRALEAGWHAKIDRARAGEQRWGWFTARRAE